MEAGSPHLHEDMRKTLGWMTLSNRRRMLRAKVVKRCLLGDAPSYLRELVKTRKMIGLRSGRRVDDIYLRTPKTNFGKYSFLYQAGLDWNSLPKSIQVLHPNSFRNEIVLYFKNFN